jgi:hypothetical protein
MDYDTWRTQGYTHTCNDCGASYTDSDGGCECGECAICGVLVRTAADWVWEDVIICEDCQDAHRAALDIAESVINKIKKELEK